MFGPLPRLHRLLVVAGALLVTIAASAWLAWMLEIALPVGGLLVGVAIGLCVAWLMVHDFHRPGEARIHRRH